MFRHLLRGMWQRIFGVNSKRSGRLSTTKRGRRRANLSLKRLEDRCVPAHTFTWNCPQNAQNSNWDTQANWRDENQAQGVPGIDDTAIFNNTSVQNATVNVAARVKQIQIQANYSGVITINVTRSLTV